MASEYHGDTYHLISKNCNHFTDDISGRLTGKRLPGWVNRLARLGTYVRPTILTFILSAFHNEHIPKYVKISQVPYVAVYFLIVFK